MAADGPTFKPLVQPDAPLVGRVFSRRDDLYLFATSATPRVSGWAGSLRRPVQALNVTSDFYRHYIKSPFRLFLLSHLQPTAHSLASMPAVCLAQSRLAPASFSVGLTLEPSLRIQIDLAGPAGRM